MDVTPLAQAVNANDRRALARAIPLVESARDDHRAAARDLIGQVAVAGRQALRIGLSGTPGVGKSTFIEAFGMMLTAQGLRVAVLAVDPSSARSGGSILGDKTRMERLSRDPMAFIRPSPERLRKKYSGEITSDPDTFAKCTDTILRQVADIGRMVDEFSSFARMPTPRMAFADISEVARSTVFAQRLVFPDIRIEVEGADQPIALVSDERLIGQALLNLIKNASESVQARRERDGEPKDGFVKLRLRDLDFGVQFEVIDNGLGFPEKDRLDRAVYNDAHQRRGPWPRYRCAHHRRPRRAD